MSGLKTVRVAPRDPNRPPTRPTIPMQQTEEEESDQTAAPPTDTTAAAQAASSSSSIVSFLCGSSDIDLPCVLRLESADHICFSLPRSLAFRMIAVQTRIANGEAIADDDGAARLFFPDINSTAMRKVVEFVTFEWRDGETLVARPGAPGAFKPENQEMQNMKEKQAEQQFMEEAEAERNDPTILESLASMDGEPVELLPRPDESMYAFLRSASSTVLCELASASFYLGVQPLVEATCRSIAGLIRGKSAEEIRQTFSIQNDFTPAEEEAVGRSIVERALLLPADMIDTHGPQALLSAPIPKAQPLLPPPISALQSKRNKLRSKLAASRANVLEPAAPPSAAPSVDELMEFIEDTGTPGEKKRRNKKAAKNTHNPTSTPAPPPATAHIDAPTSSIAIATPANALPAAVVSAPLDLDSLLLDGSSSTSAAKRKKKKSKKNKHAATLPATESGSTCPDSDSCPSSPLTSAFRKYSSSALSALMADPEALAGLLATHIEAEQQDHANQTNDATNTTTQSFANTLGALVQSLHQQRGSQPTDHTHDEHDDDDEADDDDAETRVQRHDHASDPTGSAALAAADEVRRFQRLLASASSTSHAAAAEAAQQATSTQPTDAADRPFFMPDLHLSKLIDAKLSGLANWEANQQQPLANENGHDFPPTALTLADGNDFFNAHVCSCARVRKAALPSGSSSSPPSPTLSAAAESMPYIPTVLTDRVIADTTICNQCGLLKFKADVADDSQIQLASPSKKKATSAVTSPHRKDARKAASAANALGTAATAAAIATPAASTPSLATSASSPSPSAPAASLPVSSPPKPRPSSGSCSSHGGCSCCSALAAIQPKLAELAALQHRVSSVENNAKQTSSKLVERMRAVEKIDSTFKQAQASWLKALSEERAARVKAEEQMRREADEREREWATRFEHLRAQMEEAHSTAAQSAANASNESKQRMQRVSDRIAATEKLFQSAKEDGERESKRTQARVEKLIASAVANIKLPPPSQPQPTQTNAAEEKANYAALCAKLDAQIAALDMARIQQQHDQTQAIEAAVAAALAKQTAHVGLHSSHTGVGVGSSLPSPYSSSDLLPRSLAASAHSVFSSGVGSSSIAATSTWPNQSPHAMQQIEAELLQYPFDSSNAVTASLLGDDANSAPSSYFSMFGAPMPPPPPVTVTTGAGHHGAVGADRERAHNASATGFAARPLHNMQTHTNSHGTHTQTTFTNQNRRAILHDQ